MCQRWVRARRPAWAAAIAARGQCAVAAEAGSSTDVGVLPDVASEEEARGWQAAGAGKRRAILRRRAPPWQRSADSRAPPSVRVPKSVAAAVSRVQAKLAARGDWHPDAAHRATNPAQGLLRCLLTAQEVGSREYGICVATAVEWLDMLADMSESVWRQQGRAAGWVEEGWLSDPGDDE